MLITLNQQSFPGFWCDKIWFTGAKIDHKTMQQAANSGIIRTCDGWCVYSHLILYSFYYSRIIEYVQAGWNSLIPYKRFVISLKEYGWKAVMVIGHADTRTVTGPSSCGVGATVMLLVRRCQYDMYRFTFLKRSHSPGWLPRRHWFVQ